MTSQKCQKKTTEYEVEPQVIKGVGFINSDTDYQLHHTDYGAKTPTFEGKKIFLTKLYHKAFLLASGSYEERNKLLTLKCHKFILIILN